MEEAIIMAKIKALAKVVLWSSLTGVSAVQALISFAGTINAYTSFVSGTKK